MSSSLDLLDLARDAAPAVASARSPCPDQAVLNCVELRGRVAQCRPALAWHAKALVIVDAPRSVTGLLGYLAALAAGHAVLLAEGSDSALTAELITRYAPELVVTPPRGYLAGLVAQAGYQLRVHKPLPVWHGPQNPGVPPIHPELGLLARTSGSLGVAKTVRLSFDNIRANAVAIADALGLRCSDVTLTSLPLDFSFGLSMVNSALAAGGSIALTTYGPSSQPFWEYADEVGGTCFGAVPTTYKMLRARGWDPGRHRSLRLLLHAGGALDQETLAYYRWRMAAANGEFVSMYGQTEATARISWLPAALASAYPGSSGLAIPGGRISIEQAPGRPAPDGAVGQIVFQGPSVMMGYATDRADLAEGDRQGDVLQTGDLGCLRDGYLYVTGRADRQVKVFGRRIDLDQLEALLQAQGVTAAVAALDDEHLVVVAEPAGQLDAKCRDIARSLHLPSRSVRSVTVSSLPYTTRGKIDRPALRRALKLRSPPADLSYGRANAQAACDT